MPTSKLNIQATSGKQYIYSFAEGTAEGDASMKNLLGGKGANLAEMANIGLPVPPGFTISTEVCTYYYEHQQQFPEGLFEQDIPGHSKISRLHLAKNSEIPAIRCLSRSVQEQGHRCRE